MAARNTTSQTVTMNDGNERAPAKVRKATFRRQHRASFDVKPWAKRIALGLESPGWYLLVVVGLTFLYILPLWVTEFVPSTDLHAHLALVSVAHNMADVSGLQHQVFEWGSFPTPNCLYYVLTYLISFATSVPIANQCVLSLYVVLFVACFAIFIKTFGVSRWYVLYVFLFVYNYSFIYGFIDFAFAVPLTLLAVSRVVAYCRDPSPRNGLWVGLVSVVVFFAHVQMFVLYNVFATGVYLLYLQRTDGSRWQRLVALLRLLSKRAFTLVPALVLFSIWFVRAFFVEPEAANPLGFGEIDSLGFVGDPWKLRLASIFEFTGDIFTDDSDTKLWVACLFVSLLALAGLTGKNSGKKPTKWPERYIVPALTVIACLFYMLAPAHMTGQAVIYQRFAIVILLLLVAWLSDLPFRNSIITVALFIIPMVLLNVIHARNIRYKVQLYETELQGFPEVISAARPESRLIHMMSPQASTSRFVKRYPFRHLNQYHYVLNRGVTHDSFALRPGRLLQVKPAMRMKNFPYRPNWYQNPHIWEYYDYVLTKDEPAVEQTAPHLRLLRRSGNWALYARQSSKKGD